LRRHRARRSGQGRNIILLERVFTRGRTRRARYTGETRRYGADVPGYGSQKERFGYGAMRY